MKKDEVSAKELGAFADAALHVRMHRQALSNALANVQDPERAKAIQAQTYQAMVSSIEQKGLTIEEYNLLTQWTTEDESMQKRLEKIMEAKLEAQRQQAAERGQSRKAPAPSRGAKGGPSGYDR